MLGAILDYQMNVSTVWENARRFAEDELGDPEDLWQDIVGRWTEEEWNANTTWRRYRLHRFPAGHQRVRAIGADIQDKFHGDARKIWHGQEPAEVLCRLAELGRRGVGEQLSRMIVGALIDTGLIEGEGDFKPDTHVRTVLGRLFDGTKATVERALELGEELAPGNSWELDGPLYAHGQRICTARSPRCHACALREDCAYDTEASGRLSR